MFALRNAYFSYLHNRFMYLGRGSCRGGDVRRLENRGLSPSILGGIFCSGVCRSPHVPRGRISAIFESSRRCSSVHRSLVPQMECLGPQGVHYCCNDSWDAHC
jgi:hypothetical protein